MKKFHIRAIGFIATIALLSPIAVHAEECQSTVCVDVYTQDGKIIIEGRKGGSSTSAPQPTPQVTKKPTPSKAAPVKPKPIKPNPIKPKTVAKPPVVKKVAPKKSTPTPQPPVTQSASLTDRLIKSLPTAGIAYQPEYEPLVGVPVYMWTDLPTSFMTQVKIVGEIVDVALRPSFTWSFGDGTFLSTTDLGAPFPNGKIQHTYSQAGTYAITLISTWNGTYTHNAQTRAITGTVKTTSIVMITVVTSPTRFKN
jgi:hypothetical protein